MNFDRNGTLVNKSTPTPELRTVKKVFHVDSADRDTGVYFTNGEFVVYLPRVYEKVVSLRLMSAEFSTLDLAYAHYYTNGSNVSNAVYSNDPHLHATTSSNFIPNYFLVDIEGLNKRDETAVAGNRSQYPDSFFAKIPTSSTQKLSLAAGSMGISTGYIQYNDHTQSENIANFSPPIGKLDRLRIRTRLHAQQGSQGFIYWTLSNDATTSTATATNVNGANYCLTFEVEYLDNGFDKFSSMSTRLTPGDRV
jgi:hypothetical protein